MNGLSALMQIFKKHNNGCISLHKAYGAMLSEYACDHRTMVTYCPLVPLMLFIVVPNWLFFPTADTLQVAFHPVSALNTNDHWPVRVITIQTT